MRLQILVTMTVLVMSNFVQAQVKTNYNNPDSILTKGYYNKDYKAQLYQVAIPDTQKLKERAKAEAAEEGKLRSKPYRIAEPILTGIDVADFASWVTEGDKAYGKFAIQAKKAKSLSIYFSPFYLPQGTEMFIYNEHGKMITGPITPSENNERQGWGSSILKVML